MNDDFSSSLAGEPSPVRYSSFWPLAILLSSLFIWSLFQLYLVNSQRVAVNRQYDALAPVVKPAKDAQDKLYAVAQDLMQLATKDTYAAQIVKEANIRVKDPAAAPAPAPKK